MPVCHHGQEGLQGSENQRLLLYLHFLSNYCSYLKHELRYVGGCLSVLPQSLPDWLDVMAWHNRKVLSYSLGPLSLSPSLGVLRILPRAQQALFPQVSESTLCEEALVYKSS